MKILKGILSGNATGSKRIEEAQKRPSGGGSPAGGLGDLLGSILGGGGGGAQASGGSKGGLDELLGGLLGGGGAAAQQPKPEQRAPEPKPQPRSRGGEADQATILIQAMCNAAKVDGEIDRDEQQAIVSKLGEVTQDEIDFVRAELGRPLDLDAYSRSVPPALARHAYAFSVMAIKLDQLNEAAYLGRLAAGLGLSPQDCNQIHGQIGAPALYAA